jgi:hypothetical protein
MSMLVIIMGVAKVKTSMVYMFNLLQVGCLVPIDHKYTIHMFTQLATSCSSSYGYSSKEGSTEVPLTTLYKNSLGLSILQ